MDCSPEFNELNFEPVKYVDPKGEDGPKLNELNFELNQFRDPIGRLLPEYIITKDGFVFLVMGFTS